MLKMSPGLSWGLQRSTEPKVTVREMKTLQRASPLHRAPGCKQPRLPGRERKTEEVATDSGRKEPLRWACGYRCARESTGITYDEIYFVHLKETRPSQPNAPGVGQTCCLATQPEKLTSI
ncbi:hypothetical protein R3I94_023263 [Phoxinus phoxinus]